MWTEITREEHRRESLRLRKRHDGMGNGRAVDPGRKAAGEAAQWICGVVFELARDMPSSHGAAPLHSIGIADILRRTRLGDGESARRSLHCDQSGVSGDPQDPEATLFGFDQQGHLIIHQATHDSICRLWDQLFAAHAPMAGGPALAGFAPSPRAERGHRSTQAGFRQRQFLSGISNEARELTPSRAYCRSPI